MNLFESFDEVVNDEFVEKFKSYTSDNQGDLNVAIKGIFYTLLAGMLRKTYSDMSAGMLFNQIQENGKRINLPSNLASIFSQDSVLKKIETDGNKIISQMFPAYKSPLLSLISTYAGTGKASTALATNIVSNVIISLLKKESDTNKWDRDQLVVVLRQHHDQLLNTMPESLLEKMIPSLGLHDLMVVKPFTPKKEKNDGLIPGKQAEENTEERKVDYSNLVENSEGSSKGWIIGVILALIAVGGALYYYYSQNGDLNFFAKKDVPVESVDLEAQGSEVDSLSTIETQPTPKVADDFSAFKAYVLGNDAAGKEFDFKSIQFVTDSIDVATGSVAVVDSIADLMKLNAKLQIKVMAFSGSGDVKFNNKRAFAIKRIITGKGVDGIKIDAVSGGVGEDYAKLKVISK